MRKARFTDEQMVAILRQADREAPAVSRLTPPNNYLLSPVSSPALRARRFL